MVPFARALVVWSLAALPYAIQALSEKTLMWLKASEAVDASKIVVDDHDVTTQKSTHQKYQLQNFS